MEIRKSEDSFLSSNKINNVFYTKWCAEKAPRAILLIAHGMCEYIDRYDAFARFMAAQGYAVYGNDHLGHGRSAGENVENLGYFSERDGRYDVVEDMLQLCWVSRGEYPDVPVILLGHSMGSFVARLFCAKHSNNIDAAIFMGTAGKNSAAGAGILMCNLIAAFRGERYKSKFIDGLVMGANNKRIEQPKTPSDWLSTDAAEVQKYVDDPLCGYLFTLSGYRELFSMLREVSQPEWPNTIRKDLPVLVISGAEDPVGGYGAGVQEVYSVLHNGGMEDTALLLYDGMRHEVLNEIDRQMVYDDLLEWCDGAIQS